MRLKGLMIGAVLGAVAGVPAFAPVAVAQDSIYVPLFSYRTGPFAGSGIPIANGMSDYLNMLNARDGGIGGVKIVVEECETGYDTKKGVECYERRRRRTRSSPIPIRPASRCN
jgi:branched-chain amino acid transport system substrate-binding protein